MHRIVVNIQTGEVTQVEYTPKEQAEHDAKVAQQELDRQKAELETPKTEVTPNA